jgi:hypothetical protein
VNAKPVNVGAQDPELKNSPVAWESDEDTEALREEEPGEAVCFFNGQAFDHEAVIKTGTELLRCDHGIWTPMESIDSDKL